MRGVAAGDRVADGVLAPSLAPVPAGGAPVQLGHEVRLEPLELGLEQLAHERVAAVAAGLERLEQDVGAGERLEHARGVGALEDRVAQRRRQLRGDRGPAQERQVVGAHPGEQLAAQVAGDQPVGAARPRGSAGLLRERLGGHRQRGRPAARARDESGRCRRRRAAHRRRRAAAPTRAASSRARPRPSVSASRCARRRPAAGPGRHRPASAIVHPAGSRPACSASSSTAAALARSASSSASTTGPAPACAATRRAAAPGPSSSSGRSHTNAPLVARGPLGQQRRLAEPGGGVEQDERQLVRAGEPPQQPRPRHEPGRDPRGSRGRPAGARQLAQGDGRGRGGHREPIVPRAPRGGRGCTPPTPGDAGTSPRRGISSDPGDATRPRPA